MKILQLIVSPIGFMNNLLYFLKTISPITAHIIIYNCKSCKKRIEVNPDGVLRLETTQNMPIEIAIKEKINEVQKKHMSICKDAPGNEIEIHHETTYPINLIISLTHSNMNVLENFNIGSEIYKIEALVQCNKLDNNLVLAILKKGKGNTSNLTNLIVSNFANHLNVEKATFALEDIVYDDESAAYLQQSFPRITGGGRKLNGTFSYVCAWCTQENCSGQKGKFTELKNYRDHFRKKHLGEHGTGIPMSKFDEKVENNEPKWVCTKCKTSMSFGNKNRHKEICIDDSSSNSENDTDS